MTLRIAILSFWHVHARGYAKQLSDRTDCAIVAVWDEVPERGRQMAEQFGVPFIEELRDVLARPDVDAVVVNAPSSMHPEVIVAAANAGKHIFTEKVLALRTADALRIDEAAIQNGVKLTVSLPRLGDPRTIYAKSVIDQGLLGRITFVRMRLAHDGALPREGAPDGWLPAHFFDKSECGGGALIDLGCHPMAMTYELLGMPDSVSARFGYVTGREVEDNAVVTLNYPDGGMAVIEAGFASRFCPALVELYGTEGCLLLGNQVELRSSLLPSGAHSGWLRPDKLPPGLPSPVDQWADYCLYDKAPAITVRQGIVLTQLMEAAYVSAAEERIVKLSPVAAQ
ncbi:Gfo/Idh/MocA family protein [Paenibacillus ginsengarvi]|uniref:Gfo/Idh/MocA family oxidoreductase n=1 Tax=Paenibacillus ginsengarvi TaxID=400777 RepID=A0A3B0BHN4_9BACL|nr:Gfo/Idh/MocA family oxidoreductase [Paenibacillus ginsengarvi]RKN72410.1 gfo/Idh/MocA family oxidoreductase [Paenibacillus ginsengarvi]